MKQLDPVDWEYELDQPLSGQSSTLRQELIIASSKYATCAVGEALFDYGKMMPDDSLIWRLGLAFEKAFRFGNLAEAKQIRTKIRKRFDELYGRI